MKYESLEAVFNFETCKETVVELAYDSFIVSFSSYETIKSIHISPFPTVYFNIIELCKRHSF